jgi:hypothetical protein
MFIALKAQCEFLGFLMIDAQCLCVVEGEVHLYDFVVSTYNIYYSFLLYFGFKNHCWTTYTSKEKVLYFQYRGFKYIILSPGLESIEA